MSRGKTLELMRPDPNTGKVGDIVDVSVVNYIMFLHMWRKIKKYIFLGKSLFCPHFSSEEIKFYSSLFSQ